MTAPAKPTIDEQIKEMDFIVGNIKNSGADAPKLEAILSTLRAHKAIMEAERPEEPLSVTLQRESQDEEGIRSASIAYIDALLAYAQRMVADKEAAERQLAELQAKHDALMKRLREPDEEMLAVAADAPERALARSIDEDNAAIWRAMSAVALGKEGE